MARLYFTIDTEYESGFTAKHGRDSRAANFDRAVACRMSDGEAGIFYQMDVFDRCGMKAVFFVDPMPAMLWGTGAIADIVEPIVTRGHEVQLHMHTEWLALAGDAAIVPDRGPNMKDYSQEEQCALLSYGRDVLEAAGAPRPKVFRAGNYGANDDTLRALAQLGFTHDSSHAPAIAGGACAIDLGPQHRSPLQREGVVEIPVSAIGCEESGLRHGQFTALGIHELKAMLAYAAASEHKDITLVSHSFELVSRSKNRINPLLCRRFEKFCEAVRDNPAVEAVTYAQHAPDVPPEGSETPAFPANRVHKALRLAEQAVSNALYGG
ncbi:polysaccharide deacetylase family protein [Paraurantiacibacter namhicola]|uniref:Chitooligosaccharide deacetylase n=1 Tax=Paraurantiacibacter namhicola TaxID=645517 RepID=A0A1C7D7Z8_9SPHN|nr:polysaccharide deacetylase family protein [Paraurantiacibacter namhicola]ANU07482.1 Polysaccharide deacetylase [Paraurantiacibacter namhicola]